MTNTQQHTADEAAEYFLYDKEFSAAEIRTIRALEPGLELFPAGLGKQRKLNADIRISEIARVPFGPDASWVYDRFNALARRINRNIFGFTLYTELQEKFQYTVYHGDPEAGGHYDWHRDMNNKQGMAPRKLTLVLQLSDPSEFTGGDLQLGEDPDTALTLEKRQGLIVAFPSFSKHRVTPVTSGTRRTLVLWFSGE